MSNSSHRLSLLISRVFFLYFSPLLCTLFFFSDLFNYSLRVFFRPCLPWVLMSFSFLLLCSLNVSIFSNWIIFSPFSPQLWCFAWGLSALFSQFAFILSFSQHLQFVNNQIRWRSHWHHVGLSSFSSFSISPSLSSLISQGTPDEMKHLSLFSASLHQVPPFCPSKCWLPIQMLLFRPRPDQEPSGTR